MLAGWHYLDPQEDAEIPWWDVQDAIGQVSAAGTLGLAILLPALAVTVEAEHDITPLLGAREEHIWAFQEESRGLSDFTHMDGQSSRGRRQQNRSNYSPREVWDHTRGVDVLPEALTERHLCAWG